MVVLSACEHCDDLVIVAREHFDTNIYDDPVILWPPQERTLNPAIPEALRATHSEARTCYKAKAYRATVVMVRRILEGVCIENGLTGSNLHRNLEALKTQSVIDAKLLEWAHGLRAIGNIGAHYTPANVSRQDADDALQLSEAIMDYIYVFTAKFEQFQHRKTSNPT
ncbi:DUF4145 domain-containing protein [Micromonospora carbonacea]